MGRIMMKTAVQTILLIRIVVNPAMKAKGRVPVLAAFDDGMTHGLPEKAMK
jgi:hypothetical protein